MMTTYFLARILLYYCYVKTSKSHLYHHLLFTKCVLTRNFHINLTSVKKSFYILALSIIMPLAIWAQKGERPLVQFSGFALSADSMTGIPFVHIGIKGTTRSGTARADGFFSFAVAEGDTLIFTSIGFHPAIYAIPFGNKDNKLSIIQPMNKREYVFADIPIYPWGERPEFPHYFVTTRIPRGLQEIAEANTNRQLLAAIGQTMPIDGGEATQRYMQMEAAKAYYYNQQAPQNIFSPLAWAEFIRALKNGDFKPKPAPPLPTNDY
jgi:hypothetical protein